MTINLIKDILPGSLRSIGQTRLGLDPHEIVTAGLRYRDIVNKTGGTAYKIERINSRIAFCIVVNGAYYLYVHWQYPSYRKLFKRFFGYLPEDHDVDHVMARNLARSLSVPFLLLAAVPKRANRSHGAFERHGLAPSNGIYLGKTYPLDERMFHKVMGRRVYQRQRKKDLGKGYVKGVANSFGLTLKQRGIWNLAFSTFLPFGTPPNNAKLTRI